MGQVFLGDAMMTKLMEKFTSENIRALVCPAYSPAGHKVGGVPAESDQLIRSADEHDARVDVGDHRECRAGIVGVDRQAV